MIKMHSGRIIWLQAINQSSTYAGLLAGIPRRHFNDELMAGFKKKANKEFHYEPFVLEPTRRPHDRPSDNPTLDEVWGPQEHLPSIVCTAVFHSDPVRNEREDYSFLVVLWFQDDWALPIAPEAMEAIKKIDWEPLAINWTE